MSGTQNGPGAGQPQGSDDWVGDLIIDVLKGVGVLLLAVLLLPLVVPSIALQIIHWLMGPTKARYWIVPRWWLPVMVAGVVVVVGVLAWEVWQLAAWWTSPAREEYFTGGFGQWWPETWRAALPWLALNVGIGMLLIPGALALSRRRLAQKVYMRQIDDVVRQEQIERARATAEDWSAARRAGVAMDARTGKFARQRRRPRLTGPRPLRGGALAVGLVTRQTVRTWREVTMDRRTAPDWTDGAGRWFVLPETASAVRALLLAESGTGKTVLLNLLIRAAAAKGWPVVMIDAKGDPADAHDLARVLGAAGHRVAVAPKWNLFSGSPEQITEKLMRLLPPGQGAARHYSDEARGILSMIQDGEPLRSIEDLTERLRNPAPHVRDEHDLAQVTAIVDSRTKETAAHRVAKSLAVALRPLAPYLGEDGWTYERMGADVVVVPLTPVDTAQARLGDLMLMDLRQFMADRLRRGDKTPALLIVDEFPQLVTDDTDPGAVAAALFETARSAGLGLILAGQSVAGLSSDVSMRTRALSSGAGLIIGRSKDPEAVVKLAGTMMRMEASGEAHSGELRSGRAQHTYVIPPQTVREAWNGRFWFIHGGAIASFRVLPPAPTAPTVASQEPADVVEALAEAGAVDPAPASTREEGPEEWFPIEEDPFPLDEEPFPADEGPEQADVEPAPAQEPEPVDEDQEPAPAAPVEVATATPVPRGFSAAGKAKTGTGKSTTPRKTAPGKTPAASGKTTKP